MNAAIEAQKNYNAILVAKYTELLEQWNAAMTAGDYNKGSELLVVINSYRDALGA